MKKLLAYYKKYPGDEHRSGVMNCSLEAHGLRERLTVLAHDCEPYGFLPQSIDQIARRCNADGRKRRAFDQALQELLDAGVVPQNEHGILYIPELVLQAQEREEERVKKERQRNPEKSYPLLDSSTPQYSAVPDTSAVSAVSAAPAVPAVLRQTPIKSLGTVLSAVTPQSPPHLRKKICPPDVPTSSPSASVSTSAPELVPRYRSNGGTQKLRSKKKATTETAELEWRAVEYLLAREGWNEREIRGVMPHIREKANDPPMDLELYRQIAFCLRARDKDRKPVYVWTCTKMPSDKELRQARFEYENAIGAVVAQKIPTVAAPV